MLRNPKTNIFIERKLIIMLSKFKSECPKCHKTAEGLLKFVEGAITKLFKLKEV